MKITFFYYKCYLGGLESAVKNKMDYLTDLGIDCQIIFLDKGLEDHTFSSYKHYVTTDDNTLKNLTKDSDIIINLSPYDIMFKRAYKLDKPIIHECHCGGAYEYLGHLDPGRVKAVIFPTKHNLIRAGKIIGGNIPIFALHNCLGKNFTESTPSVLTPVKKIILWVGRIEYYKNWPLIVKLSQMLSSDYLIRVVTETALSSQYKEFLREVENKHLKGRIEIDINCPYSAMSYHYFQAAISGCYLSSSYSESFGMTVLESMYAGCPMVLSDLPSFREIAENSAIYFPTDNAEICIEGINKLCTDIPFRKEMIKNEISLYTMNFDPIKTCKEYLNIVKQVL